MGYDNYPDGFGPSGQYSSTYRSIFGPWYCEDCGEELHGADEENEGLCSGCQEAKESETDLEDEDGEE